MVFFLVALAVLLIASSMQSPWIRASLYVWTFAALVAAHYSLHRMADLSTVGRDGVYMPQLAPVDELPYTLAAAAGYCFAVVWIFVLETRKLPFTTRKKIALGGVAMAVAITYATTITVINPGWRLSWAYPGAEIDVDWPYSPPSLHPHLSSFIRHISPVPYIGPGEYAVVHFTHLSYPLRFDAVRKERVKFVEVFDCKILDVSAMFPEQGLVVFGKCDFSQLPKEQRDKLKIEWDEGLKENTYYISRE